MTVKKSVKSLIWAAIMSLSASALSRIIILNLSFFLKSEPIYADIFNATSHAKIDIPVLFLTLISFVFCFWAERFSKSKIAKAVFIPAGVFVWLIVICAALFTAKVNGIMFGDVILSLLDIVKKGGAF